MELLSTCTTWCWRATGFACANTNIPTAKPHVPVCPSAQSIRQNYLPPHSFFALPSRSTIMASQKTVVFSLSFMTPPAPLRKSCTRDCCKLSRAISSRDSTVETRRSESLTALETLRAALQELDVAAAQYLARPVARKHDISRPADVQESNPQSSTANLASEKSFMRSPDIGRTTQLKSERRQVIEPEQAAFRGLLNVVWGWWCRVTHGRTDR